MAGGRNFDLLPSAIASALWGRTVVHAAAPFFRKVEQPEPSFKTFENPFP